MPTTKDHAELIADNIECASQVRWSSDSHRDDAIRNIEDGLRRAITEATSGLQEELRAANQAYRSLETTGDFAGNCQKCGGEVFHRHGQPGEFDHDCKSDLCDQNDRPTDVRGKPVVLGRWYWATSRTGQVVGTGKFLATIGSGEWSFYINGTGYAADSFTYEKAMPPTSEVLARIKKFVAREVRGLGEGRCYFPCDEPWVCGECGGSFHGDLAAGNPCPGCGDPIVFEDGV